MSEALDKARAALLATTDLDPENSYDIKVKLDLYDVAKTQAAIALAEATERLAACAEFAQYQAQTVLAEYRAQIAPPFRQKGW